MITRTFYKTTGGVVEAVLKDGKPSFETIIESFEVFTTSKYDQFSILKKLKNEYDGISPRTIVTNYHAEEIVLGVSEEDFIRCAKPVERYKKGDK